MAGMGWRTTGDVAGFLAAAGEYLRRERARNTVILTVSEQLRVNPAHYSGPPAADGRPDPARQPLFGWYAGRAGAVAGAFLHTPPHPLLLTAVPAGVAAGLAEALAGRPLTAVNGHVEAAREFAAAWQAATPGTRATEQRRMRLYRLGELAGRIPRPTARRGSPPTPTRRCSPAGSPRSPTRCTTRTRGRTRRAPCARNSATAAS